MNRYVKLDDGSWGVRIVGPDAEEIGPDCEVKVRTKAGKVDIQRTQKLAWRGKTVNGEPVVHFSVYGNAKIKCPKCEHEF